MNEVPLSLANGNLITLFQ